MVDIPLISHKKDLRIDAGVSLLPSVHATVSYGLTDKIAIQGFGTIGVGDRYYLQAATGFFKKKLNNRVFEIYGGFGHGFGNAYNDANPGNLRGSYQLYFGQFNYGKALNNASNVEIGFGVKTGLLNTNMLDKNYYNEGFANEPFIRYHDKSILLEPVGFIRFGGERLKFSIKLGTTFMYQFTNTNKDFPYSIINLGFGINYRL